MLSSKRLQRGNWTTDLTTATSYQWPILSHRSAAVAECGITLFTFVRYHLRIPQQCCFSVFIDCITAGRANCSIHRRSLYREWLLPNHLRCFALSGSCHTISRRKISYAAANKQEKQKTRAKTLNPFIWAYNNSRFSTPASSALMV